MSDQPNPYAPPRLDLDYHPSHAGSDGGLRREGDLVVIPTRGAVFPARCVVCNDPAPHRLQRKLYWHPPAYYATICLGALIYVIVALIVRKAANFEIALCDVHSARRRNGILLGWIGVPLCFIGGALLSGVAPEWPLVGMVTGLILLIVAVVMVKLVTAARIDDRNAWLKVGKPFLDSI